MRLGSSDSHLSIDVNSLIMTAIFYDIYLFLISTLFKILELATSSYVGSVFRVRVNTSINTVNKAVTTIPLDKVNNHFSHRIIINYDF
jgi:hypothetical protein